jgi:hypothetical protein
LASNSSRWSRPSILSEIPSSYARTRARRTFTDPSGAGFSGAACGCSCPPAARLARRDSADFLWASRALAESNSGMATR